MTRRRSADDVDLNVTAMLDMAFQLLAFFVLTFRPAPVEPAVMLHMPPALPVAKVGEPPPGVGPHVTPAGIDTLRINLFSTSGGLDRMTINDFPAETFEVLRDHMRKFLADPGSPIEQVVVQASEDLRYDEVMKVIGICTEQTLPRTGELVKLSLVAMGNGAEM
jgi:biopolymer transport protein ExbD